MSPRHRLVLMRHASAENFEAGDQGRRLSERGRAEAAEMGAWLAGSGITPDEALVSAARRTRETWAEASTAAGWDIEPGVSEALYSAGPESALDLIRAADPGSGTLLVIGHNPTMAYLAGMLDDQESQTERDAGFVAGTAAVFSYDGEWAELSYASCRLEAVHSPSAERG